MAFGSAPQERPRLHNRATGIPLAKGLGSDCVSSSRTGILGKGFASLKSCIEKSHSKATLIKADGHMVLRRRPVNLMSEISIFQTHAPSLHTFQKKACARWRNFAIAVGLTAIGNYNARTTVQRGGTDTWRPRVFAMEDCFFKSPQPWCKRQSHRPAKTLSCAGVNRAGPYTTTFCLGKAPAEECTSREPKNEAATSDINASGHNWTNYNSCSSRRSGKHIGTRPPTGMYSACHPTEYAVFLVD